MIILVKAEDTGKGLDDYFQDGILKRTLEREGYKNVYIQSGEWNGTKHYLYGLIKIKKEGRVSIEANALLYNYSLNKNIFDTLMTLG